MNTENSTGKPARLPLAERAKRGLLAAEPLLSTDDIAGLEHLANLPARQALRATLDALIDCGALPERFIETWIDYSQGGLSQRFDGDYRLESAPVRHATPAVDRESYRAWRLTCPPELLSPLSQIHKWLGATPAIETSLPEPVAHGGAAEKPPVALQSLLAEIDKRAAEQGAGFNRRCLPGTKKEFQVLAIAFNRRAFCKSLATFDDYLDGKCQFQRGIEPEQGKGAAIWALFPEYPNLKLG